MADDTLVLTKLEAVKQHALGLKEISRAGTATTLSIADIAIGERLIPEVQNRRPARRLHATDEAIDANPSSSDVGWSLYVDRWLKSNRGTEATRGN